MDNKKRRVLKRVQKKLVEYCHDKDCTDIWRCPRDHEKCKDKLDLDTAIAWRTNLLIKDILIKYIDKETAFALFFLGWSIVEFHKEKYKELYEIINELWEVIY